MTQLQNRRMHPAPAGSTCHDPRHANPCPQPCAACEEECDPRYLRLPLTPGHRPLITHHTDEALQSLKEGEPGTISVTRVTLGPILVRARAYRVRGAYLDAVATDGARWGTNLWALRRGLSEGEAVARAVQVFISAFGAQRQVA